MHFHAFKWHKYPDMQKSSCIVCVCVEPWNATYFRELWPQGQSSWLCHSSCACL